MPWTDELSEGLKGNAVLGKYESSEAALQGLVDAQDLIGKKGIIPPGEGASSEVVEAFKTSITEHRDSIMPILVQVPEKAEDYEVKIPDDAPKDLPVNEKLLTGFKAKAHELKLSASQGTGIAGWFNKFQIDTYIEDQAACETTKADNTTARQKEHGNDYEEKLKLNKAVLKRFGGAETLKFYEDSGFIMHPGTFKLLAGIAGVISEDILFESEQGAGEFEGDLTEDKLKEMMKDPRYNDPYKRDKEFVKKVTEGWKKLHPGTISG